MNIFQEKSPSPSKEVGRGRAEDITLIEDDFETVAQFHPVCSDDFGEWEAIVADSNQAPLPSFNLPFAVTTPFRVPSPALPNELVIYVFPYPHSSSHHTYSLSVSLEEMDGTYRFITIPMT